jgi:GT2 family glycosyltransferase
MYNDTAIVILNFNGKNWLSKFIPTFIQYSEDIPIYVADNFSSDDSMEWLKVNFPSVKTIFLDQNYGFAEGYNKALQQIKSKYYIIVNSDIEVTQGWIFPCIEMLDNDSTIAACQPKILNYNHKDTFEYAGGAGGFIDKYGYPFCRGRIFDSCEKDTGQYDDECEIFWASGACFFVRADVFHQLGGFDATYFAHNEEIDLCWRMQLEGYKIMYTSKSTVYHVGGGTLHKSNPFKTFLNIRNNRQMLFKLTNEIILCKTLIIRNLFDFVFIIKTIVSFDFLNVKAILKGLKDYYFRKKITKRIVHQKQLNTMYHKSIVLDYFVRNIKSFKSLRF